MSLLLERFDCIVVSKPFIRKSGSAIEIRGLRDLEYFSACCLQVLPSFLNRSKMVTIHLFEKFKFLTSLN